MNAEAKALREKFLAIADSRVRYARLDADNAAGPDQARYVKTWESLAALADELRAAKIEPIA